MPPESPAPARPPSLAILEDRRRALRFAAGVTLSTAFIYAVELPIGFLCSVLAASFLATRGPRPGLLLAAAVAGSVAIAFLAGTLITLGTLQSPAIYYVAMFLLIYQVLLRSVRGAPALAMLMLLLGVVLTPVVGISSTQLSVDFALDFVSASVCALLIVALAYALVPDRPGTRYDTKASNPLDDPRDSHRYALSRTLALMPLLIWVVALQQTGDVAVLLYAAILIQAPSAAGGRAAGQAMIVGSAIGGGAAILIYVVGTVVPSFTIFLGLVALVSLLLGRAIFSERPNALLFAKAPAAMLVLMDKGNALLGDQTADALVTRLIALTIATFYVAFAGILIEAWQPTAEARQGSPPARA